MSESASGPFLFSGQRERRHLFFSQNELRQHGILWLWSVLGGCFFLWVLLDWIWPPLGLEPQTLRFMQMGRLVVGILLWAGVGVVLRFRQADLTAIVVEWLGWLVVSLYLGLAGAWLYGGGSALVSVLLALLVVARGILLPGGLRGYWPPVLLLWAIYLFSLVVFTQHQTGSSWLVGGLVFSQVLFVLACVLGGIAAWWFAQLRAFLVQTDRLGRYQIGDQLRTRGMSQLYHAWHVLLQQHCILKRIPCNSSNWDDAVKEFRREAKLVMGIQNPHVVRVFDFGESLQDLYLVMEYLDGINLSALLRLQGALPPKRAAHLMQQVCLGIAEVHRQGILHQDIKPGNLFLIAEKNEYDYIKVIDFGIARRLEATPEQLAARGLGKIPGTPAYMAPERFSGQGDERSDIYAMGAVLYCLLVGRPPFRAEQTTEYQALHEEEPIPLEPLRKACPDLPKELEELIVRALAKDPKDRFASAEAMREALLQCQQSMGKWTQEEAKQAWDTLTEHRTQHSSAALPGEGQALMTPASVQSIPLPSPSKLPASSRPLPEEPAHESPALILPDPDSPDLQPSTPNAVETTPSSPSTSSQTKVNEAQTPHATGASAPQAQQASNHTKTPESPLSTQETSASK